MLQPAIYSVPGAAVNCITAWPRPGELAVNCMEPGLSVEPTTTMHLPLNAWRSLALSGSCSKAEGFQRKVARMQRREEEIGAADPQTVSICLGSILAFFFCIFAFIFHRMVTA
jgi:hypothetical protein